MTGESIKQRLRLTLEAVLIASIVSLPLILSVLSDFECSRRTDSGVCVAYSRK